MPVFRIPQAQGGQLAPGKIVLPEVAAVDTNFFVGAYIDQDPVKIAALNVFEQSGTMLMVPSKTVDELTFRIQVIGESRYAPQVMPGQAKPKFGTVLTNLPYERSLITDFASTVLNLLDTAPYVVIDTTTLDIRFGLNLFEGYGIMNADAQILATALRNGVCDIISDDGDFTRVQNINHWTTQPVPTTHMAQPVIFDVAHWMAYAPPGFFLGPPSAQTGSAKPKDDSGSSA
jgi:predicted nucleic acid-binding protein